MNSKSNKKLKKKKKLSIKSLPSKLKPRSDRKSLRLSIRRQRAISPVPKATAVAAILVTQAVLPLKTKLARILTTLRTQLKPLSAKKPEKNLKRKF